MSSGNNYNNINNNKDIGKMKNTVSPVTISKNKTSNSSLGTSNNQPDVEWTIKQSKRNLSSSTNSEPNSPPNRYEALASNDVQDSNQLNNQFDFSLNDSTENTTTNMQTDCTNDPPIKPPPPIFVRGVEDFPELCTILIALIGVDNFVCKSFTDRLKIQTSTPDAYRSLIRYLKEEKAEYHTYQLQQDKPVRVVIRNLHPSTPTTLIKSELELLQFEVRNITNVLHKTNKYPLPLFFVDLEPNSQSKDIYKLTSLLHTKIKVEEPFKAKTISQCLNCQNYGHTKTYCGYPPRCVRCGACHTSSACTKPRDTPPTCALCQGSHPASYKGCVVYKDLQRRKKPSTSNHFFLSHNIRDKSSVVKDSHPTNDTSPNPNPSYAQATSGQSSNQHPPPPRILNL
ncbi:Uncharacterized protein FWK35_00036217 [Aphis craccivora]|uniref:Pre-C2HC domain-containing protein n=1 Tax=Aphis craccivora TaxID=307492 RepID=A0A6G0W0G8_APHCR|nr:Uncharacterized protein FWK35_00036217 [Aphis craccivora]